MAQLNDLYFNPFENNKTQLLQNLYSAKSLHRRRSFVRIFDALENSAGFFKLLTGYLKHCYSSPIQIWLTSGFFVRESTQSSTYLLQLVKDEVF